VTDTPDLVEQLNGMLVADNLHIYQKRTISEAADEIERLSELIDAVADAGGNYADLSRAAMRIREAPGD
jgi:hypothetical protein